MSRTGVPAAVLTAAGRQARTTLLRKYTSAGGIGTIIFSLVMLAIVWLLRDADFRQGQVAASVYLMGGFLAFGVVAAAVIGVASELQYERDDGTLLRAKGVPHGMTGHLIAKLMAAPLDAILPLLPAVLGVSLLVPGVMPDSLTGWGLLVLVFLLAVAAMLPWGAVLGSAFRTMLGLGFAMMGVYALAALSGVFYPIAGWPAPIQAIAQATPLYWIGHAVRSVLLPAEAAVGEVGGEFRLALALLVLVGWAVVGLLLAPVLLRRMARRQSGSAVAAARDRVLSKGY